MDVGVRYTGTEPLGLWPSMVAVTDKDHAPQHLNYQDTLRYYRDNQKSYGVLWMDAPNNAVYRIVGWNGGLFSPDYRCTERGDWELVGLWSIPNQPPPDDDEDGGSPVPAIPGPNVGHPSGAR